MLRDDKVFCVIEMILRVFIQVFQDVLFFGLFGILSALLMQPRSGSYSHLPCRAPKITPSRVAGRRGGLPWSHLCLFFGFMKFGS
jgi:hypothetical protein